MIGAREAAILTLREVFYEGAYSNIAVGDMLKRHRDMDRNEKSFFTNLVYGVVSRHYTLEYVLKKYSSIKPKKLSKYVGIILETGFYQLMYLSKIPESAAVNESVKLAKKYAPKGADKFVNAVLRSFCRDGKKAIFPNGDLAVKHSFSPAMAQSFENMFGYETADLLMGALNEVPDMLLRPNVLKTDPTELSARLSEYGVENTVTEYEMIKAQGFDIFGNALYREGFYTPQDRGAYTASQVLEPRSGETIIDMCAAPGGKTTHIAELMGDDGKITAFDKYEHKIGLIDASARRLGLKSIRAVKADSTRFDEKYVRSADRVLCDVPCSGWGIIRRKPDIKLAHTDLDELYRIQENILCNAAAYVKSGGCIVYSTCTVNKLENETRISEFLDKHKDFDKVYEKTFYPHIDGCDGFYICRLDKK